VVDMMLHDRPDLVIHRTEIWVFGNFGGHRLGAVNSGVYYGRPLSVSGRPCYILPMFFLFIFFNGRLILRPWLTEVRENFTRGRP